MAYLTIAAVALLASALTFFSGFGLGTLLLPAFAFFVPLDRAIALTAIVHLLNGLFKLALVGRHADGGIVLRFGVPALIGALVGAGLLLVLADLPPLLTYTLAGREWRVLPIKVVIGLLLLGFAAIEVVPALRERTFPAGWLPLGGLLSGFFGGLAGMQGALRSAFLARAGLSKEAFIATGVVLGCLIDVARLGLYATLLAREWARLDMLLLGTAVAAALTGALVGNRLLGKMTMHQIRWLVAVLLVLVAGGLIAGWL